MNKELDFLKVYIMMEICLECHKFIKDKMSIM